MAFDFFKRSKKEPKPPKQAKADAASDAPAAESAAPTVKAAGGNVLKRYFVSEKSTRGFAMNQYTFEVDRSATKTDVRDAVQRGYDVDVTSVNIVRLPAKKITLGRFKGEKGGIKKAIVTLKAGQSIAQAKP